MVNPIRKKVPNGEANGSSTPKGGDDPLVIDVKYADPVLWTIFREAMRNGDIQEAKDKLHELYRRWDRGKTGSSIVEIVEDAQTGIFAGGFDPTRDYTETGLRPMFIKPGQISHGEQALRDWQYIQTHQFQTHFRLSPVEASFSYPEQGYSLLVTQPIVGPTVSKVFRALDGVINGLLIDTGQTEIARELKEEIIRKRLKDLAWWVKYMGEAVPEEIRVTDPQKVIERYQEGIRNAFENATRYTTDGHHPFVLSSLEREMLECSLNVYHQLNLGNGRLVRIRDDTDANCGIELGRMEFSDIGELAKRTIDTLTYELTPGSGRKVDPTGIENRFGHWDTGNPNFGHVEEDLWRALDSASTNIPEADKKVHLINFLRLLYGPEYEPHDVVMDDSLIRTFRNWRHRDVVITRFTPKNEQRFDLYDANSSDEGEREQRMRQRDQRRAYYETSAAHYAKMALQGLEYAVIDLHKPFIGTIATLELEALKQNYDMAQQLLARYSPQLQGELLRNIGVINRSANSPNQEIRNLASAMALHILATKAARYSQIDYVSLPKPD